MKKKYKKFYALLVILCFIMNCNHTSKYISKTKTDSNGYSYSYVEKDPMNVRIYTLENGLTVYISKNDEIPRIQTYVAVKTGSNNDPDDNTGLAHYLEHLLFKGNNEFGTKNWEEEKKLLDKIETLFEKHKHANSKEEQKNIYKEIDSLSNEASKLAIANEYDKICEIIGTKGTNAHTWFEETIYHNNIPANELERWSKLESSRFSNIALRLFHTELETVYEEFNRYQDNDQSRAIEKLFYLLFPQHPYGEKPTIGLPKHLKTPSMTAIYEYFNTYYVPNNMAIILSGDLDYEATIQTISNYFGTLKSKPLPKKTPFKKLSEIAKPIIDTVTGPTPEMLFLAFRTGGLSTKDRFLGEMFSYLMYNDQAGILDLNLNQTQKVLESGAGNYTLNDYGFVYFYGVPLENQSLQEVSSLILKQIEEIKKGNIDPRLVEGAKNTLYKQSQNILEGNKRASLMYKAFISNLKWEEELAFIETLKNISTEDIIEFTNRTFKDNYVLIYKKQGPADEVEKIDKPLITDVEVDREHQSDFVTKLEKIKVDPIKPEFPNLKYAIKTESVKNLNFSFIQNESSDLFNFNLIWNFGSRAFKQLPIGSELLDFCGTSKLDASEFSLNLFSLGAKFSISVKPEETILKISGIDSKLNESLTLIYELLNSASINENTYLDFVAKKAKERQDAKSEKGSIKKALASYVLFGENSDFRNIYSIDSLKSFKADFFLTSIKELFNYPHEIFYYGTKPHVAKEFVTNSENGTYKKTPNNLLNISFKETPAKVYFVDYDMVQTEIILLANTNTPFNKDLLPQISIFNSYFGSGLSSIVFQEIRESKALAYSAYSFFKTPNKKEDPFILNAYVGTQADKLEEATSTLLKLHKNLPISNSKIQNAVLSELKNFESQRIKKSEPFWKLHQWKKLNISSQEHFRENYYNKLKTINADSLNTFFNTFVKNSSFSFCVLGKKENIDFKILQKLGPVSKLDINFYSMTKNTFIKLFLVTIACIFSNCFNTSYAFKVNSIVIEPVTDTTEILNNDKQEGLMVIDANGTLFVYNGSRFIEQLNSQSNTSKPPFVTNADTDWQLQGDNSLEIELNGYYFTPTTQFTNLPSNVTQTILEINPNYAKIQLQDTGNTYYSHTEISFGNHEEWNGTPTLRIERVDYATDNNGYITYLDGSIARDCRDYIRTLADAPDGIYRLSIDNTKDIPLYCDMTDHDGGWTLVYKNSPAYGNLHSDNESAQGDQSCLTHLTANCSAKLADSDINNLKNDIIYGNDNDRKKVYRMTSPNRLNDSYYAFGKCTYSQSSRITNTNCSQFSPSYSTNGGGEQTCRHDWPISAGIVLWNNCTGSNTIDHFILTAPQYSDFTPQFGDGSSQTYTSEAFEKKFNNALYIWVRWEIF